MKTDKGKLFGTMSNGEIEIRSLTKDDLEQALDVLHKSFFLNENVCRATEIDLPQSVQAREELTEFCRIVSEDGITLIAKHIPTNKVIGVAFNKIQHQCSPDEETFFDEFIRTKCKSSNAKSLMQYMATMDEKFNVYEYFKIDCSVEIVFLATLPEFGRKGIAYSLCHHSVALSKNLLNGLDLDIVCEKLQNKRPKAVSATFTSKYSQSIGKKLGMEFLLDIPYTEFTYNGKTYADRIGSIHPSGILCALKL